MTTHNELRHLYGKQYAERFEKGQKPYRLKRLIADMRLSLQDNVVDFACGSGMLMLYVAPLVNSYVGVDFSQPFIDLANVKKNSSGITNAKFECAPVAEFCRSNVSVFNVAFALDFAEHVYDKEWLQILTNIRGSLVPGGKLYLEPISKSLEQDAN